MTADAAAPDALAMDIWEVSDGHQDELIAGVEQLLACVEHAPGFLGAEVLESIDRTQVVVSLRMRSEADRVAAYEDRRTMAALRKLEQIGRSHLRRYSLVRSFEPSREPSHAGAHGN